MCVNEIVHMWCNVKCLVHLNGYRHPEGWQCLQFVYSIGRAKVVYSADHMFSLYFDFLILVISHFCFEGWIWVPIASVPDLCMLVYFWTVEYLPIIALPGNTNRFPMNLWILLQNDQMSIDVRNPKARAYPVKLYFKHVCLIKETKKESTLG